MYKSHVVIGRIIEIHADRVLTQQGDTLCTYHPRYYMLPEAETWGPAEGDLNVEPAGQVDGRAGAYAHRLRWKAMMHWFLPQKKSANRI